MRHYLIYFFCLVISLLIGNHQLFTQTIRFTTLREPGTIIKLSLQYKGSLTIKGVKEHYSSSQELQAYTLLDQDVVISGDVISLRASQIDMSSLEVSKCSSLVELDCSQNALTNLDLSQAPALTKLVCFANHLTRIIFPAESPLMQLKCTNNRLSTLDLSSLKNLEELTCSNNELKTLDVTALGRLKTLKCYQNKLSSLDLTSCTLLEKLWCSDNQLQYLDLSANSQLRVVWCYNNQITRISHRELPRLIWLYCEENNLVSLDCSQMPELKKLSIYGNKIQDSAMASLVASLPERKSPLGSMIVVNTQNETEENVCSTISVSQAATRGWLVLDYCGGANDHQGVEYLGSPVAIEPAYSDQPVHFVWHGDMLTLSKLTNGCEVALYDLLGELLYIAPSPISGELLIWIPEYISPPLLLVVDGLLIAKLYSQ